MLCLVRVPRSEWLVPYIAADSFQRGKGRCAQETGCFNKRKLLKGTKVQEQVPRLPGLDVGTRVDLSGQLGQGGPEILLDLLGALFPINLFCI